MTSDLAASPAIRHQRQRRPKRNYSNGATAHVNTACRRLRQTVESAPQKGRTRS